MNENTIYTWSFSEEKNRWALWYIIAISIVIWFAFWWIITQIYWLSIAIVLAAGILFYIENNSSKIVEVEITTLWISFWWVLYDFWKIDNFSFIYYKKNAIYLKIVLNKKWLKNINLRVDNKICEDLKQILPNFIKEEKDWDLTFADRLINFLKL